MALHLTQNCHCLHRSWKLPVHHLEWGGEAVVGKGAEKEWERSGGEGGGEGSGEGGAGEGGGKGGGKGGGGGCHGVK